MCIRLYIKYIDSSISDDRKLKPSVQYLFMGKMISYPKLYSTIYIYATTIINLSCIFTITIIDLLFYKKENYKSLYLCIGIMTKKLDSLSSSVMLSLKARYKKQNK